MLMCNSPIGTVAYMGGVYAVPEEFCWSMVQMVQLNHEQLCQPGEYVHYERSRVSYHAFARNSLVDNMKGDWLLMLDTDHEFEPDICVRMVSLLIRFQIDVLTAVYRYKKRPHVPVLYRKKEKSLGYAAIGKWTEGARILPVDSAGAGCLLVRRTVFERIKKELKCGPFDVTHPLSEDHSFFSRLAELNIKAYFAPHIEYPHLAVKAITASDYDPGELLMEQPVAVEGMR